jgi:RNA polymerase sigma-70 factor (ECF subfamily)
MPEPATYDARLDDELLVALRGLTAQQRVVIVLHYYVDCSVREIGRRTGMNPLAVRSHLSRGRQRLRQLLGEGEHV